MSVRHPEEDDALLDIANMRIPLLFTATKMAQETEQVIAADLSLLLSGVEHLEWVPEIPPRQWRDVIITHELRGWQAKELPDIIKECFGAVTTVDDVRYLVIPDELVDSYRKSLEIKRRHPDMCNRLNEFIALLEDSQALGALASDAANADRMVHCYKTSRKEGLRVLEEYASLNMNVRQPSLLDIKPFSEVVGEEDEVGDVFVVSSVITWNDKRTGAPRQQKLPLGIYVDNRWRVLSFPMP